MLKPIFSATAKASSVVPDFEHSNLNFTKSWLFSKFFAIGWSIESAINEGLKPQIYTHPLGTFGHSSGTTFGMWDSQQGVPFNGDHPLQYNTVYAIELNTKVFIKEWNKEIRIMLEEAGFYGKNGFRYVNGRETEIILIGKKDKAINNWLKWIYF